MTPEQVYARFCKEFPGVVPMVVKFFSRHPDDTDYAIRVVLNNNRSMIFGLNKDGSYKLEGVSNARRR